MVEQGSQSVNCGRCLYHTVLVNPSCYFLHFFVEWKGKWNIYFFLVHQLSHFIKPQTCLSQCSIFNKTPNCLTCILILKLHPGFRKMKRWDTEAAVCDQSVNKISSLKLVSINSNDLSFTRLNDSVEVEQDQHLVFLYLEWHDPEQFAIITVYGNMQRVQIHGRAEESTESPCVRSTSWKRKCCAGLRLGAMFFKHWPHLQQHPFPEKGSQRKSKRERETDVEGRGWKATSSLADNNFYYPTVLHEKKPIHKCGLIGLHSSLHNMNSHFSHYTREKPVLISIPLTNFYHRIIASSSSNLLWNLVDLAKTLNLNFPGMHITFETLWVNTQKSRLNMFLISSESVSVKELNWLLCEHQLVWIKQLHRSEFSRFCMMPNENR